MEKKNHLLLGICVLFAVGCFSGCGPSKNKEKPGDSNVPAEQLSQPVDTLSQPDETNNAENEDERFLSWAEIPADGKVVRLDFEKWLTIMDYIHDNYWSRPTAKMLADAGLEVLYETDSIDEDGIKDVHFIYGRQAKKVKGPDGEEYSTFDGEHAILFEVSAYTSSGAEIHFHHPADLRDFMEQAIQRGVAGSPDRRLIVCDKPMGKGFHQILKVYDPSEKPQGTYTERYYLSAKYEPDAIWHTCHVTLDFLRHTIDIEE